MLNDGNFYIKPGSAADIPYIKASTIDPLGEVKPTTLDLSKYKIDLLMVDGKAYFPLTTISDLFCSSLVSAEYVNGEINFVLTMESFMTGKLTDSYVDRTGLYETQERPEDAAEYTYNEMCFLFDTIYGKPSQCEFANVIREKGFDQALETYDETTGYLFLTYAGRNIENAILDCVRKAKATLEGHLSYDDACEWTEKRLDEVKKNYL